MFGCIYNSNPLTFEDDNKVSGKINYNSYAGMIGGVIGRASGATVQEVQTALKNVMVDDDVITPSGDSIGKYCGSPLVNSLE